VNLPFLAFSHWRARFSRLRSRSSGLVDHNNRKDINEGYAILLRMDCSLKLRVSLLRRVLLTQSSRPSPALFIGTGTSLPSPSIDNTPHEGRGGGSRSMEDVAMSRRGGKGEARRG